MTPQPWEVYRHYKSTGWDHHTYEVLWVAKHSETGDMMVVYRPLFDGENTWLGDASMAVRPLNMWSEEVFSQWENKVRFVLMQEE
jgi:hypothetical protein